MSSHNAVPSSSKLQTKKVPMPEGGRLWYTLKFMECVIVVSCLLILVLTQYLHNVVDDFTPLTNKNKTESIEDTTGLSVTTTTSKKLRIEPTTESRRSNEIPQIILISKDSTETLNRTRLKEQDDYLESELTNWDTQIRINESLKRVKKVSDKEELGNKAKCAAGPISLNDLLIMFPCSTTLLMVIVMEILGVVFKDPLSKLSNMILIFLAILLAITLLTISLLAYLRTAHVTLILITILSAFLVVVEFINFILLQLS